MTISAMRNDMNIRHQKKYKNDPPKKTRFTTQKNTNPIKNKHIKSDVNNTKIQNVRNQSSKAIPKSTSKSKNVSTHVTQTSNIEFQIPSAELDYYNVRIFVLKYFLDHNRDLNNEVTLQILDKTIHKILKHLNEEQS